MNSVKYLMLALLIALAACGDDESFPPESCAALNDTEVFINENELVGICFTDPDGDAITVTASPSDPSVIDVAVQGSGRALLIRGLSVGESIVNVVATDATGKTTETIFAVEVPNRAPEVEDQLPEITLTDAVPTVSLALTQYFADPDEHPLSFTAQSSDAAVVRISVQDSVIDFHQVGNGDAVVEVTATDPYGDFATGRTSVSIRISVELLSDDFAELNSLWALGEYTTANIEEGRLALTVSDPNFFGQLERRVLPSGNWSVSTEVEYATNNMWPAIWLIESSDPVRIVAVLIGGDLRRLATDPRGIPETNIAVALNIDGRWVTAGDWSTLAAGVPGPDERAQVTVRMEADGLKILIGGEQVHQVPLKSGDLTLPTEIIGLALVAWPPLDVESLDGSELTYFDFIEARGTLIDESVAAQMPLPRTLSRPGAIRIKK